MFSILQRQLDDIRAVLLDKPSQQIERDGKKAIRWLFYDRGEYITSAKSICYIIGFDVELLQDRVKLWSTYYDTIRNRIVFEQNGFSICANEHYNDALPTPKLTVWADPSYVEEDDC